MKRLAPILMVVALGLVLPPAARAQNNTLGTAATYVLNQGWIFVDMGGAPNNQRWYRYGVIAGRSYCAEQVAGDAPTATQDGEVDVFQQNGINLIGRSDDLTPFIEPGYDNQTGTPGRVCYVAPVSENNYAQVGNRLFSATAQRYKFRVVETTLYSPWFFSAAGFEAFVLLRNTTSANIRASVTLRSTGGGALGTQSATVPPNGSYNLQVSAPPPTGFSIASSGSVEVAFSSGANGNNALVAVGAPGSLVGNVTSLNFTSGVSFDTVFAPRQDWTR